MARAVVIRTLIREGEAFATLDSARSPAPNEPVEGAIDSAIDGVELLGQEAWGELLVMWGAVLGGVEDFAATGAGVVHVPEQPIELRLRRCRAGGMTVEVDDGVERRGALDERAFVEAVLAAARRFLAWAGQHGIAAAETRAVGAAIDRLEAARS